MLLFGFYLIKKARIGFDLICLYLFARLEGAVFEFDLYFHLAARSGVTGRVLFPRGGLELADR